MELDRSLRAVCVILVVWTASSSAREGVTDDIYARIETLEERATQCDEKITRQERVFDRKLANQNLVHVKQIAKQKRLISELQTLVTKQSNTIHVLENDLETQKELVKQLIGSIESNTIVDERKTAAPDDVDGHKGNDKGGSGGHGLHREHTGIRPGRFVAEGPVAFQAEVNRHNITHIGIGQKISYDTVHLNLGGGFHNQHGLFIAPQPGLYIFSTSVMSEYKPHNIIWVGIRKNGQRLAGAFAYGATERDQGSVTVVTQLAVGDEVWVSLDGLVDDSLTGDGFTSFMGCLV